MMEKQREWRGGIAPSLSIYPTHTVRTEFAAGTNGQEMGGE